MVKLFKNNLFWSLLLFFAVIICSVLSKWFGFLDLGIFNYSLLIVLSLLIPNVLILGKEINNSEVEIIKLPFCELKLIKKYDYYFIGIWQGSTSGDLVVLDYYKNIFNKKDAFKLFRSDYPNEKSYEIIEIVKQVHYKMNDD